MHTIQQKLIRLAETYNIGAMSLRELGEIINVDHPQTIKYHLEQLEEKKLIKWDREKKQITRLTTEAASNSDLLVIPVVGAANCGPANIYAWEHIVDHIKVSRRLLGDKTGIFAVRAVGQSMDKANIAGKNIEPGDYVLVDPSDKNIHTNDYVLSIIDQMANIKKVVIDKDHRQIALLSESTGNFPAIYIDETEADNYFVNGKVIQVIKP